MEIPILADLVAKQYLEQSESIKNLEEYTRNAPEDKEAIIGILDSFGTWLVEEDLRIFKDL